MLGLLEPDIKLEQKNLNFFHWEQFAKGPPEPVIDEVQAAIEAKVLAAGTEIWQR
jgi:hypothetical protein